VTTEAGQVCIAGGGIAGLTLALKLHSVGITCTVFEAVNEIRAIGVGINIQTSGVLELYKLGLREALDRTGVQTRELAYYLADGTRVLADPRGVHAGCKVPQLSIHRGKLQEILLAAVRERLGAVRVRTGHRVVGFSQPEGGGRVRVQVEVAGQAQPLEVECDALVGCDGIHSRVRAQLYPGEGGPCFAKGLRWDEASEEWVERRDAPGGLMLWRGVSRMASFAGGDMMFMAGTNAAKLVVYPIDNELRAKGERCGVSIRHCCLHCCLLLAACCLLPLPSDARRSACGC
jgi:2-polyprenyl-6-methoxyphenol hydroxylase-like FAD-dependent oxidoreductase